MKITKRILLHSHTESFNLGLSENNQRSFCLTRLKYIEYRTPSCRVEQKWISNTRRSCRL